jgi:RES domain-containing protein
LKFSRFEDECFRSHEPKWASKPLSGEGARLHGGRFNPVGVPALYLALTVEGAVLEGRQGISRRMQPQTLVSYDVECDDLLDLRTARNRTSAKVAIEDLTCAWFDDYRAGREPRSWTVAQRLIARGAAGILVPSFATGATPGMANLVLWRWGPDLPHKVTAHDPSGRLPKNQLSWEP